MSAGITRLAARILIASAHGPVIHYDVAGTPILSSKTAALAGLEKAEGKAGSGQGTVIVWPATRTAPGERYVVTL